ncbi:alpha/beta fold hydrolase [Kordia aestuariivivens]|nr:alpha/beta fold hydrolase [Kordia aestuariivivens]
MKAQNIAFENTAPFYNYEELQNDNIVWGYLTIPENWEKENSKKIKIAVTVLKNTAKNENAKAVVFIQGGPGSSGIATIWSWLMHPLRKTHDIVLFDVRGTGFSTPRLCPNLGKELLEILAKNQSAEEDEKQKTSIALSCKEKLIKNDIDIEAYNSKSIAKDLHVLKEKLGYDAWNVYGASYGTYIAQIYASEFPEDIKSLILDSSIDDITTYYTKNTSNYINTLRKVFTGCEADPNCKAAYPDLEKMYYEVIAALEKEPITVAVDENLIASGGFTFNAEDFKIAIHQALYNKQLVEMIPLLIYQFHEKNKGTLGNLVPALSSLIQMDYGVYYCVSCNEVLPVNNFDAYKENAAQFDKLNGGISFYKSDFKVCEKWNLNRIHIDSVSKSESLKTLKETSFPVLLFSGEYDPITPQNNGENTANNFKSAYNIIGKTYGHVPGFTRIGNDVTTKFTTNPHETIDVNAFEKAKKVVFVTNIKPNVGVSRMGNSLSANEPIFLFPLFIALGIMLIYILVHTINFFRKKYARSSDKIIRLLTIITSIVGLGSLISLIMSIQEIANYNYFILAVGLPDRFNYIFWIVLLFFGLLITTILYFAISVKKITNRSILFSILFSNILLATYLFYWGVI